MRHIDEYETTNNSSVWKKIHKLIHAGCSYCKWHRNENASASSQKEFGCQKKKKVEKVSLKEVVK
jgi:hypothetical protein